MTFRVGDRIRCGPGPWYPDTLVGATGVVVEVGEWIVARLDNPSRNPDGDLPGFVNTAFPEKLELLLEDDDNVALA